jgi:hypothetical protein
VIASPYCRFELESFLAREAALGAGGCSAAADDPVLSLMRASQGREARRAAGADAYQVRAGHQP